MMTNLQIFDKVCNHLMTQGTPAQNSASQCRYRTGGLQCAAGCLIADEHYRLGLEGPASRRPRDH